MKSKTRYFTSKCVRKTLSCLLYNYPSQIVTKRYVPVRMCSKAFRNEVSRVFHKLFLSDNENII